ncbi:MAG: M48 family metallopeptidase [Thermodesulfobacteriota bacterium]
MRHYLIIFISCLVLNLSGCENTDIQLATGAGIDAIKAITLTDEAVAELSRKSSEYLDSQHTVAPETNKFAQRLSTLTGDLYGEDDFTFKYKVYLDNQVNAFAMADGTIRVYSGLMDMLDNGELHFVIGHEMGHVVRQHTRKRLRLAYGAKAVRKGIASQNSAAGNIAGSQIGGVVEMLIGAQFSQLEEKVADDYGLTFLKKKGYPPEKAVSALKKLATLGGNHSFLSSHPDPEARAKRIELQIQGKALSIEDARQGFIDKILARLEKWFPAIFASFSQVLSSAINKPLQA